MNDENATYGQTESLLYPCPPGTGLGYKNSSGTVYLICDERFPSLQPPNFESPISSPLFYTAIAIVCFLVIGIVCNTRKRRQENTYYSEV
ncbi:MAG: hypothetical protein EBU82_05145 [Flavobacteriia bacterium]|nr:hypothetical protein [Flavobacteriia bacterium]